MAAKWKAHPGAEGAKPLQRLPRTNVSQPKQAGSRPPPGFLTIREAGKRLGRHELTVYRYIRRGLLRVKLVGWRVFVEQKSVEWWLKPRLYDPRRPAPPWLRKTPRKVRGQATAAPVSAALEGAPPAGGETPAADSAALEAKA